jgi:hypothetical protein
MGEGDVTTTLASVKLVVAVPDEPVAVTVYTAMNQSGRLNESVSAPVASATTSTSRFHV